MKLAKCLKITKTKNFDVFVYPKGHIKYKRGMDEAYTDIFGVERDQNGKIIMSDKLEVYKDYKVTEIILNASCIGIVVEG